MESTEFEKKYFDARIEEINGLTEISPILKVIAEVPPKDIKNSESELSKKIISLREKTHQLDKNFRYRDPHDNENNEILLNNLNENRAELEIFSEYSSALKNTLRTRKEMTKKSHNVFRIVGSVCLTAFLFADLTGLAKDQHPHQSYETNIENNVLGSARDMAFISIFGVAGGIAYGSYAHDKLMPRLARRKARKIINTIDI